MKPAVALLLLIGLLLPCAGCGTTRSSRVDVGPEKGSDVAIESRLEMFDPRVVADGTARRLELTLHNSTSKSLEFLFTVDWLDRNGQLVPLTARRWVRVELDGDASRALRIEGMPPEATSFQLRYSPARK